MHNVIIPPQEPLVWHVLHNKSFGPSSQSLIGIIKYYINSCLKFACSPAKFNIAIAASPHPMDYENIMIVVISIITSDDNRSRNAGDIQSSIDIACFNNTIRLFQTEPITVKCSDVLIVPADGVIRSGNDVHRVRNCRLNDVANKDLETLLDGNLARQCVIHGQFDTMKYKEKRQMLRLIKLKQFFKNLDNGPNELLRAQDGDKSDHREGGGGVQYTHGND
jgi:hypothetical protein